MKNLIKKSNEEVKVLSINTLRSFAKKAIEHELKHFDQFIGKDIFKVDFSIKKKFEHEKLQSFEGFFEDGTHYNVHYWYEIDNYNFKIKVKSCVNGGSYDVYPATAFCCYDTETFYLYETKGAILTASPQNREYLDEVFVLSEIQEKANKLKELKEAYKKEYNNFPYQFKEVFYISHFNR